MPRLSGTFTADNTQSAELLLKPGQGYALSLTPSPSLTGAIALQRRRLSTAVYEDVTVFTGTQALTEYRNDLNEPVVIRLYCRDLDAGTETVAYVLRSLLSGTRVLCDARAKVGTTSGWVVNAANDLGLMATLPAGQSGSTLVVRPDFLSVGAVIEGFYPVGQVESAGNTASLTVELRKMTAAAADVVDASVATTGAVSYTADTVLGRVSQAADDVNAIVQDGESYYFLVTGTTAASTDFALQGIMLQFRNGH